jgi:fermentation-respiration switch protein FrsA (DUF1100 family)
MSGRLVHRYEHGQARRLPVAIDRRRQGVFIVVFRWLENRLVYRPRRAAESWIDPPSPDVRDVQLTSADGTRLHAWFWPQEGDTGAVLASHGNGGNLSHRAPFMENLRRHLGRSILIYDYPGYGKSAGKPSEAGCYAAGDAALRWLTGEQGVSPERVVLLGESLGGGVAVDVATRQNHEALALLFTFTSLPATAQRHYRWLPCRLLMSNRFDNLAKIGRCHRPVFIAHGTDDTVIPFAQGQELFAAANETKRFLPLEGHYHSIDVGEQFYTELRRFLNERSGSKNTS